MTIHRANESDCRAVAEVHVESWQHAYKDIMPRQFLASLSVDEREAMWRQFVVRNSGHLLVAQGSKNIVGFVALGACQDETESQACAEIWALYVKPSFWSTGAGRELWLAALQQLSQECFITVNLWVLSSNHRAIEFYKSAGFAPEVGMIKQIDIGGVTLEEQRYSRIIGN